MARVQHMGECPPYRDTADVGRNRYGFDNPLRYFTTETLVAPSESWQVTPYDCGMPGCNDGAGCWKCISDTGRFVGYTVKHLPTGHVWVITAEPPESWCDTMIHLGRWPD